MWKTELNNNKVLKVENELIKLENEFEIVTSSLKDSISNSTNKYQNTIETLVNNKNNELNNLRENSKNERKKIITKYNQKIESINNKHLTEISIFKEKISEQNEEKLALIELNKNLVEKGDKKDDEISQYIKTISELERQVLENKVSQEAINLYTKSLINEMEDDKKFAKGWKKRAKSYDEAIRLYILAKKNGLVNLDSTIKSVRVKRDNIDKDNLKNKTEYY